MKAVGPKEADIVGIRPLRRVDGGRHGASSARSRFIVHSRQTFKTLIKDAM